MKVAPERPWESYQYTSDDRIITSTFYAEANKITQDEYSHCARVIISIKDPGPSGGPSRAEAGTLWAMEDELTTALEQRKVKCVQVGRLTDGGQREIVFQLHDWETFRPPVGKWMQSHPDYDIGVAEHEGWNFFFDCVWPSETSWQMIMDRRVIESLKKNGSDLSKEHSLEFVFYGNPEPLARMRERLATRSYTFLSQEEGRLIMTKRMVPVLNDIWTESLAHCRDAKEFGIEYDGWGCLAGR